ncbi:MAG TPA: hypothetical protein GX703_02070 [Erysipelothrix sp.]|nr:hypothetical protein [Erysipelothrix sp.]
MLPVIFNKQSYSFDKGNIYGLKPEHSDFLITVALSSPDVFFFGSPSWFDSNLLGLDYLKYIMNMWKSNKELDDIIQYWELSAIIDMPIRSYSLGEKQCLIAALYQISDAQIIVIDNITVGMDEYFQKKLFDMMVLLKEESKTIIVSCQYEDKMRSVSDVFIEDEAL